MTRKEKRKFALNSIWFEKDEWVINVCCISVNKMKNVFHISFKKHFKTDCNRMNRSSTASRKWTGSNGKQCINRGIDRHRGRSRVAGINGNQYINEIVTFIMNYLYHKHYSEYPLLQLTCTLIIRWFKPFNLFADHFAFQQVDWLFKHRIIE